MWFCTLFRLIWLYVLHGKIGIRILEQTLYLTDILIHLKGVTMISHEDIGLHLQNFRSWEEKDLNFGPADEYCMIHLCGKNGVGKSSVLEALVFALTGRDSSGGAYPTHFIKKGAERAIVVLRTPTWSLSRSLTEKRNGTLKIRRFEGIPVNITQSELMQSFGVTEELILSALVPGYFMRLPQSKRLKILSESTPKIDRNAIVANLCGKSESWVKRMVGDLSQKITTLTSVSLSRIEKDRELARVEGKIESCMQILEGCGSPPSPKHNLESLDADILSSIRAKDAYDAAIELYRHKVQAREAILAGNQKKERLAKKTLKAIEDLSNKPVVIDSDRSEYIKLESTLKSFPAKPELASVPSSDHCHTCGQAISIAHREKVSATREATTTAYWNAYRAVEEHNQPILRSLREMAAVLDAQHEAFLKMKDEEKHRKTMLSSLEWTLMTTTPDPVPEEPTLPAYPEIVYMPEQVESIKKERDRYLGEKAAYESLLLRRDKTRLDLDNLHSRALELKESISEWEALENAIKNLSHEEVLMKRNLFGISLPGVEVSMEEGFDIFTTEGLPYMCMSEGQRLRVNVELCVKFHSFIASLGFEKSAKFYPVIFIDNADLADWYKTLVLPETIRKVFFAHVDPEQEELKMMTRGTKW